MPEQRSWCCGFIPGFWWWLLALLGLPLLFLMMTYFRQGVVEGDLTTRVSDKLAEENINWAEVDVEHRGRDVLLKGTFPDEDERDRALTVAQGVHGVNRVDFDVDSAMAEALDMPTLDVKLSGGKLVLDGEVASQQQVDALVKAAGERFGADKVTNQLTVGGNMDSPEWLSSADELLDIMPDKEAALSISEDGLEISGKVDSDSTKQAMLKRARGLLGEGAAGKIVERIEVKPLLPAELDVAMVGEKLTLKGKVSSQAQADALLQLASGRVGKDNVVNGLEISDGYAEAAWLDAAKPLISDVLADKGTARISEGSVEITAEVESDNARKELVTKSNRVFKDSGLTLVHNIVVKEPAQSAAELAARACQEKLDTALTGKKVLFQVNKAGIRNESHALLDELAGIVADCKDNLKGKRVAIGGHTDSDGPDEYNLRLSQSRAEAVGNYLKKKGVPADLIETKGFGETQAVASNDTAEGKAQNRRISFEIKSAE